MKSGKSGSLRVVAIGFGGSTVTLVLLTPWLSWWNVVTLYALLNLIFINSLVIFLIARHLRLCHLRSRLSVQWQKKTTGNGQVIRRQASDYNLFVLGSGGHTKEMLMMMDDGFTKFDNFHRRYLISSGDSMSKNHVEDYEEDLRALCQKNGASPGTFDIRLVHRARRVHQSLLTTPLSGLWSFCDILKVLLSPPIKGSAPSQPDTVLEFPSLVLSNGPATGFFVALAIHILKMFYIIPEDKCLFVYIESWARISTLSLTGKLLYYTGIADDFAVQHEQVASQYGLPNAGPLVFNSRRSI